MMSFNTTPKKVQKTNDKKQKRQRKQKVLQSPLNDLEAYKNVDMKEIRVAVPEDGSVPTWRDATTGKVQAMVKSRAEDGTFEYRPRIKAGPRAGKKYRPRVAKIAQLMKNADKNGGALTMDGMAVLNDCISKLPGSRAPFNAGSDKTSVENFTEANTKPAALDYQALIHAWQMRSMGMIADEEFLLIKQSIFGAAAAPKVEQKKEEVVRSDVETPSAEQVTF